MPQDQVSISQPRITGRKAITVAPAINMGADFDPSSPQFPWMPNSPTSLTSGLQEAFNYAAATGRGVELLPGTFVCSVPLAIGWDPCHIEGAGKGQSTIQFESGAITAGQYGIYFSVIPTAPFMGSFNIDFQGNVGVAALAYNTAVGYVETERAGFLFDVEVLNASTATTAAIIGDGMEDFVYLRVDCFGTQVVSHQVPNGNVHVFGSHFGYMTCSAQVSDVVGTTIGNTFTITGTANYQYYNFYSCYFNGTTSGASAIVDSGSNQHQVKFYGGCVAVTGSPTGVVSGSNVTNVWITFDRTRLAVPSGIPIHSSATGVAQLRDVTLNSGAATLTQLMANSQSSSALASITPTSGTAFAAVGANTGLVMIAIYGGTVTEIQITRGGTATQVGSSTPAYLVCGPGDTVTITFSSAPTVYRIPIF